MSVVQLTILDWHVIRLGGTARTDLVRVSSSIVLPTSNWHTVYGILCSKQSVLFSCQNTDCCCSVVVVDLIGLLLTWCCSGRKFFVDGVAPFRTNVHIFSISILVVSFVITSRTTTTRSLLAYQCQQWCTYDDGRQNCSTTMIIARSAREQTSHSCVVCSIRRLL